jgi:hypothetical protein
MNPDLGLIARRWVLDFIAGAERPVPKPPPHRIARIRFGASRARNLTPEQKVMAEAFGIVRDGQELPYSIDVDDETTGEQLDFAGTEVVSVTVENPDLGDLAPPDENGEGVFSVKDGSSGVTAVTISLRWSDSGEAMDLVGTVSVNPRNRTASISFGEAREAADTPA